MGSSTVGCSRVNRVLSVEQGIAIPVLTTLPHSAAGCATAAELTDVPAPCQCSLGSK